MNYKRTELGENIGFTSFADKKFNTCFVCIYMITEMNKETVSDYAVANSITSTVNSRLRTIAAMNEQLSELYGAHLDSYANRRGDLQFLTLSASWLSNRYAIENEDITGKMLEIITDCLFEPLFDEDIFKLGKKNILDCIDAEFNDKREYTISKARSIAFKGEPAENSSCGTRETAEAVTLESVREAYKRLMETARIEIMYVSPDEEPRVSELFRKRFAGIERHSMPYNFYAPSPLKASSELLTEEFDVRQAKIALNFKYDGSDTDAMHLMCIIFGGTPVSKLFANVREKLSLCYYCACRMNEFKNTIIVDCGVERSNIEKAEAEIMRQLEEIKKGNITDEELQSALLALENSYSSFGDTPGSYVSWYFDCICKNSYITPFEHMERLFDVTKERIVAAAKTVKLDSIYHMLNKEAE